MEGVRATGIDGPRACGAIIQETAELAVTDEDMARLASKLPMLLTPGAAEALVVKAYRGMRWSVTRLYRGAFLLTTDLRLIVKTATGVTYSNKSRGFEHLHPEVEGFFVPIRTCFEMRELSTADSAVDSWRRRTLEAVLTWPDAK
jgi:hypothetical protein